MTNEQLDIEALVLRTAEGTYYGVDPVWWTPKDGTGGPQKEST